MKIFISLFLAWMVAFSASARLQGDGYYRVHNYKSNRYVYVMDDKGSLDFQSTTAEVGAIELWMTPEKRISDPASVIYVTDLTGQNKDFDFQAQGTGVKTIISHSVSVVIRNNQLGTYRIFGRDSGFTRYLGDATKSLDYDRGYLSTTDNGDWCDWYFTPIAADSDEYFGVVPTVKVGDDYYQPFFADFPFEPASEGMEVFYINQIDTAEGLAVLEKIEGVVPRATAVLIKCSTNDPSANRLTLGGTASNLTDNKLDGVFFENYDRLKHNNLTPYDPNTMRLLSVNDGGELVYSTAELENVPRNQAYLTVPAGSPADFKIVTREAYEEYIANKTFTLTYLVDGEVYKTYEHKAGETITAEPDPEREGYTFSGWEGLPEVMPAQNVTVSGTFNINTYYLRIFIDDQMRHEVGILFGDTIVIPELDIPEGREFDHWVENEIPTTMPAHDVELHAMTKSGIEEIIADMPGTHVDVYTLQGRLVLRNVAKDEIFSRLTSGIYVIGNKKILIP